MHSAIKELAILFKGSILDSITIVKKLFKLIIPVVILIKILSELKILPYLAYPFEPIMYLVGLPAEYGLAVVTAIFMTLSAGIVVFVSLIPELGTPTLAQASTFSIIVLIAHAMILECKIAQECGVSFWGQFMLRLIIAILAGVIMNVFYMLTDFHQEPAHILLEVSTDTSLMTWVKNELFNLCYIAFIIWVVLLGHAILVRLNVTTYLEKMLEPLLRIAGISSAAASIIVVGFTVGILYGGGILIKETQQNRMTKKDLFCAISLMGVAHALIEDTILMLLVGASVWVTFVFRIIFVIACAAAISFLYDKFVEKPIKSVVKS